MMKRRSYRPRTVLIIMCLLLSALVAAQQQATPYMEPLPDDSVELVLYSDTTTFNEDTLASGFGECDTDDCTLVGRDAELWNFFTDVVGVGFFSSLIIVVLLLLGLPLLLVLLVIYLLYRSAKGRPAPSPEEDRRSSILQLSTAAALLAAEIWIGCGGLLGCIAIFLACWACGRLIAARITARRKRKGGEAGTGDESDGPADEESGRQA